MDTVAALVLNGRARRASGLADRFRARAAAGGHTPLVLMTTPQDDGTGAARQALSAGAAVVFAAGGDGTVRACAQALAGTDVPLAIVPAGSANLTARALRLPRGLEAALDAGFGGAERRLDLALVANAGVHSASGDGPVRDGPDAGMMCAAMAGIGVDAAVVGGTPDGLKRRAGWPAYAAAAFGHLLGPLGEFMISLDGGPPVSHWARSVVVGNCGLLPGGFPILPDARPDDGVLDIGILAPAGLPGWVSVGCRAVLGSRRDDAQLTRLRARTVRVQASVPQPRQVDGEVIGAAAELTVSVRPAALRVRVSSGYLLPGGSPAG